VFSIAVVELEQIRKPANNIWAVKPAEYFDNETLMLDLVNSIFKNKVHPEAFIIKSL
jgi:anaerobic glycerol-3-phosphate dehydrogenase